MLRDAVDHVAVPPVDHPVESAAQAHGARDDAVENGLHIRRRTGDDAQDLTGRRLLLERLGHLGVGRRKRLVLLLQLSEQADILDRDHGLVGEGLEQGDLFVGERTDRRAGHDDRSDRAALTPHGDDEQAA